MGNTRENECITREGRRNKIVCMLTLKGKMCKYAQGCYATQKCIANIKNMQKK